MQSVLAQDPSSGSSSSRSGGNDDSNATSSQVKTNAVVGSSSSSGDCNNIFGITLLSTEQTKSIGASHKLKNLLASNRLRDDIRSIVNSGDRVATLRKLRSIKPEFEVFVDVLLAEIDGSQGNQKRRKTQ